jgi:hypothetical protein
MVLLVRFASRLQVPWDDRIGAAKAEQHAGADGLDLATSHERLCAVGSA